MRRALLVALALVLGLGPLTACGKKAPPTLPEGEQLQVQKKGRKQTTKVKTPYAPGGSESGAPTESGAAPEEGTAPETPAPPEGGTAPEQGQPPSPGGPGEGGF